MNTYRNVAVVLAAGATCLSLAACSAGITTASTATAGPAGSSRSATAAAATSPSAARTAASRTIHVDDGVGSFPLPTGANVAENISTDQGVIIFFDRVSPGKVADFYGQALPRAGYRITTNSMLGQSSSTGAFIQFTGHGVTGTIDALSSFTHMGVKIAGLGTKNVTNITFTPKKK